MWLNRLRGRLLRFAFHHFYNTFAWSYDAVSALVSLGHWREWTQAAIPHLRGKQVRYLAVRPDKTEPIKEIEFIKGGDVTAPIVVAVTVETPG